MFDFTTTLKTALEASGLSVYYELFVDSTVTKPCITILEANNSQNITGDNLGYSDISYYVKL